MSVKVYHSKYKNIDCLVMENERMAIKVIPRSGGKVQSIFDMTTGTEYLYQSPRQEYRLPKYNSPFIKGEGSGFDEMFPTITPCYYPDEPWAGIFLPDHGEVWALPWECSMEEDGIRTVVHGVRLPYLLERSMKFTGKDSFIINYRLINKTGFPMKFIWAAHPLLNIDENSVIVLPKEVSQVMNVLHGAKRLGNYGQLHNWPETTTPDGRKYDMSRLNPENRDNDKYYVHGNIPRGECALYNSKAKNYIKFVFPMDKVPYLGIWVNENGPLLGQCNAALEPCTGALDGIDVANKFGQLSMVEANGTFEWFLEIQLGEAENKDEVIK